jgi:hypothetical protein
LPTKIALKPSAARADLGADELRPSTDRGTTVGIGTILGFVAVFFGGGTALALMLCGSGDDADRRFDATLDAATDELEREANELVLH